MEPYTILICSVSSWDGFQLLFQINQMKQDADNFESEATRRKRKDFSHRLASVVDIL